MGCRAGNIQLYAEFPAEEGEWNSCAQHLTLAHLICFHLFSHTWLSCPLLTEFYLTLSILFSLTSIFSYSHSILPHLISSRLFSHSWLSSPISVNPSQTMERVKEQGVKRNTVFKNSAYGASHWFPPIKYDGVGLVSNTLFTSAISIKCCIKFFFFSWHFWRIQTNFRWSLSLSDFIVTITVQDIDVDCYRNDPSVLPCFNFQI